MKIHIIGIAGKTSATLAKMLVDKGHVVTGSDQGCYPPMTDYLDQIGVVYKTPYHEVNLPIDVELVVVAGNALIINPQNPEFLRAKELGIPIQSYPEVLQSFVVKPESIVVVGNYGKGTVSGAITKALVDAGKDPSYMVSGLMEDLPESLRSTESEWSVIEGDEYPVPPIEDSKPMSKFFYYKPKYLVLTSSEWDHFDKFPTEREYIDNYIRLIRRLPNDGVLVANLDGEHVHEVVEEARKTSCRVVTYSLVHKEADFVAETLPLKPQLLGRFNVSNLTAAYALLMTLGFDADASIQSLNSYRGLKQRMTVLHEDESIVVVRDLAHSPIKAKSAISAAKETWPNHTLVAVLDIVASSLKSKTVLSRIVGALDDADQVFIPRVKIGNYVDRSTVATGKEIVDAIRTTQPHVSYEPKDSELHKKILEIRGPKVVLLMSSGGLDGLEDELLEQIR